MATKTDVSDQRLAEFGEIIRSFMMLRHRLRMVTPETFASVKERLHELLPEGHQWGKNEPDLFFSVGTLLMRQAEPVTMGELSQALNVPLSTATRIVDTLVKLDYAQRLPDPDDRRVVRVTLTETGKQMYTGIQGFFETRLRHILGYFTEDEQESLLGLMKKLQKAIYEEQDQMNG